MNNIILLIFSLVLTGCGSYTNVSCPNSYNLLHKTLPIYFSIDESFTETEVNEIHKAAQAWNSLANYPIISFKDDAYPIKLTSNISNTKNAITYTHYQYGYITHIAIDVSLSKYKMLDLQSLMIHEFGHTLGIQHIEDTVMHPSLGRNEINRYIDKSVITVLSCLYPSLVK